MALLSFRSLLVQARIGGMYAALDSIDASKMLMDRPFCTSVVQLAAFAVFESNPKFTGPYFQYVSQGQIRSSKMLVNRVYVAARCW